jgi:hypothetical protein
MDKYKEAIERLKQWDREHHDGGYSIQERDEFIFPELKIDESENERIRKWLICLLNEMQYHHCDDDREMGNKALAWLEKKGEPTAIPADAVLDSNKDGLIADTIRCKIEKQGEQKPVKVPKFKVGDFIQFNGMGHTRYTVKEVCGLSHYINTCNKRMDMSYTDANFELVKQKPAEWSEEDREMRMKVLKYLSTRCNVFEYEEVENWLRSLRPQSRWKPSYVQMEVLLSEVTAWTKGCPKQIVLESLYNDLKRLLKI